jgi:hypothetical protein
MAAGQASGATSASADCSYLQFARLQQQVLCSRQQHIQELCGTKHKNKKTIPSNNFGFMPKGKQGVCSLIW